MDKIKIAIIGSGPAGMACAKKLAENTNVKVKVFDELKEFGGMLAYGIPEFRLPLTQVRQNVDSAKEKGIEFENKKIKSVKELLKENGGEFDFVVLAIGAGEGFSLGLKGEESSGVIDSLEFLKKAKLENELMINESDKVAVIGGGNSAIATALLAKKCCNDVSIIYRRTESEMPAFGNELKEAKDAGIKFEFLKSPLEYVEKESGKILVKFALMKLGEKDESGRAKPMDSGKRVEEEFDKILLAIGQRNSLEWLEKEGVECERGRIKVDENNASSLENVYACGDCVYGAKNIAEATMSGSKTAISILKKLEK